MRERARVGEILVAAGIIDEMQLNSALGEQQRWGKRLGVTLIKMGMVEEGHLIRALAKQLDLPVASLAGKRIPPEVIALVPSSIASKHGVMPLFTKGQGPNTQLYLGMEDPSNLAVLDDLSFRTGMEIRPVMIGPSELGEAIDRYYHGRNGGAPQVDPFRGGDTMNPASLRVVTDDSAHPGTAPAEPSIESEVAKATAPAPTPAPTAANVEPPRDALDLSDDAAPPSRDPLDFADEASSSDPLDLSEEAPAPALDLVDEAQPAPSPIAPPPAQAAPAAAQPPVVEAPPAPVAAPAVPTIEPEPVAAPTAPTIEPARVEHLEAEVAELRRQIALLHEDAERAIDETERTRVVAKAMTQLLIDGGQLSLEALQTRIVELKQQGAHTGRASDGEADAAQTPIGDA